MAFWMHYYWIYVMRSASIVEKEPRQLGRGPETVFRFPAQQLQAGIRNGSGRDV